MAKKTEEAINAGVFLLFIAAIVFVVGWYVGYTNETGQIIGIFGFLSLFGGIVNIKYPEKYGHIGISIMNYFKGIGEKSANYNSKNKTEMNVKDNKVKGDLTAINAKNSQIHIINKDKTDNDKAILQIGKKTEDVLFNPPFLGKETTFRYKCIRIIVENTGQIAAKECKGYFSTDVSSVRVCWTVPTERPNATINVGDAERLDFCAFPMGVKGNYSIIVPNENGWDNFGHVDLNAPIVKLKVRVSSGNAEPTEAIVVINCEQKTIEIQ